MISCFCDITFFHLFQNFKLRSLRKFSCSNSTSSTSNKLCHVFPPKALYVIFTSFVSREFGTPSLPPTNLSLSIASIRRIVKSTHWNHFVENSDPDNPCMQFSFQMPMSYLLLPAASKLLNLMITTASLLIK